MAVMVSHLCQAQTHTITRPTTTQSNKAQSATTRQRTTQTQTKKQNTQPSTTVPDTKKEEMVVSQNVSTDSASFEVVDNQNTEKIDSKLQEFLIQLENDMVFVDGGMLNLGATKEQKKDAFKNEKPSFLAQISSFYMCKHEVTQAEWNVVMGNNPSQFKGDNLPVESVSREDCLEFIDKINQLTGKKYSLPTSAEWEYAARGGQQSHGTKYPGSNNVYEVAWFRDNSADHTHDVMTLKANELGLYDMCGNVDEWCVDCLTDYNSSYKKDPVGKIGNSTNDCSTIRGGSYFDSSPFMRSSYHSAIGVKNHSKFTGFRLVCH